MRTSPWLVFTYSVIIVLGMLIALPNVLPQSALNRIPAWLPHSQVALGLDLRGGSHLVLEVDEGDLVHERLQTLVQDARRVLRAKNIQTKSVVQNATQVVIALTDPSQSDAAVTELKTLANTITTGISAGQSDLSVTPNNGIITLAYSQVGINANVDAAVQQSLEIIRQRVDQVGVSEPTIQRIGNNRVLVQLPGTQDPSRLRELLGSTAKMSFHMLSDSGDLTNPGPGVTVMKDDKGNSYAIQDRVELSGDRLADARVSFDQNTHEPLVTFRFDSAGANRFAEITRANVGKPFAIILDNKVLSAPVIREPITGGSGQISGSFTAESATTLSALLRAGALPAKLTVIEERTVGADLGADAIKMGIYSGLVGFALVALFIFVLYGTWGILANVALLIHTILTFSALTLVGATLTLPGIAGIVLGIGLAVDANVLINERIREETRKGRGAFAAIDNGFRRAYSTIIDGNMTALIAAAILFYFGSGPVRGFAVTMGLGLIISMFTSVAFVRVVMIAIARRRKLKVINIQSMFRFSPYDRHIQFMKARFFGVAVSAILSLASIGLFIYPGLNYGVDFRGGIQMSVKTQGTADLSTFREGLNTLGLGEITLQSFGDKNTILVRAQRQDGGEEAQTAAVTKLKAEVTKIDPTATVEGTDVIGPKVSGELAWAGILSVVIASFAMLFYIWFRFEWPFAVGAIVTLVLDVTKLVGFFAITGLDFNLTAIAAVLTMVGYSVNDKVVVYDRMRENMRLYKSMPLREIIDKSINETLARSLYTNATAFLALVPMAIWGGSAVSSFAIPMVFGILVAGASSIFIAAPILLFLGDWRTRHRAVTVANDAKAAEAEAAKPKKQLPAAE
ncbi:protein translocase subunit SecD [Rhizobium tumorigenes]|uniref:protein translocase subunit SecD n=1 Tax=Rhizobium tumorigenes TaxID=2041385 RepID=UPI002420172B|nr:protein translocase subunit SecD [Rhizobium tumorigenes]WFS01236.1 protein translocase subunit SecD [Rhizobium tumorigenes]